MYASLKRAMMFLTGLIERWRSAVTPGGKVR